MAQYPFRQPATEDDSENSDWTPPSYAKPLSDSDGNWQPPSYAKAVDTKEDDKKPSVFKRAWDAVSQPLTDIPSKIANKIGEAIDKPSLTRGKTRAEIEGFLAGATEAGGKFISGLTSPLNLGLTASGIGEEIPAISQVAKTARRVLSVPVAAEGAKNTYEGVKNKDFMQTVQGAIEAGLGAAGSVSGGHVPEVDAESADVAKSPETPSSQSIRQTTKRLAPSLTNTTPQQDAVAIALTKDSIPRTASNISKETGIPQASVRQTLSEIKDKTKIGEQESIPSTALKDEIPLKQADKLKNDPYEFAGESIDLPDVQPRDFGYDENKDLSIRQPSQVLQPPATQDEETPIEPEQPKAKFVNPFEKQSTAEDTEIIPSRPDITPSMIRENKRIKDLQLANDKPTAIFKGMQETGDPKNPEMALYDIKGGPSNGSTVTEAKLKELNIDVPENKTPQAKPDTWTPPGYAKAIEPSDTRMLELQQKFGGIKNDKPITVNFAGGNPKEWTKETIDDMNEYPDLSKVTKKPTPEPKVPTKKDIFDPTNKDITEMHGGLGGIKPSTRELEPNSGPYGAALDKLFSSMGSLKESRVQQDIINKTERAKRFAAFNDVKDVGVSGAAQSLSKLKGEFEKVDVDKLKMTQPQVDSLFTAVKRANITPGEKARGYTTLFKIFNGDLPQRNELQILDDVFGNHFSDKIMQMHGGIGAVGLNVSKLANTMKSMQNAMSLAAPLRHGIGLLARKEFYPAFADMFKFFGNKEFYDQSMQAIEEHPNYMLSREGGLFISKPNSVLSSEEEFLNSYVGKIPFVRDAVGASQRAYSGFLNKLRFDTFNGMIEKAKALGHDTGTQVGESVVPTKETKTIANFINNATGRGDLGRLNKMTNELNTLLWSPRMIASRVTMLTNPSIYTSLPKGMRMEGIKSLLAIASLGTVIDTLATYGGAKVSTNILSSDAGKSRFGKDVIDPWGGFQQYVVAAARFLAGKTDSKTPTSRLKIAGNFLASKESPATDLAHMLLTAKKFTGKSTDPATAGNFVDQYNNKTTIQSEVAKRFTPIFIQDLQDLVKSDSKFSNSIGLDSALTGASLAGMEQSYPEPKASGQLSIRKPQLR